MDECRWCPHKGCNTFLKTSYLLDHAKFAHGSVELIQRILSEKENCDSVIKAVSPGESGASRSNQNNNAVLTSVDSQTKTPKKNNEVISMPLSVSPSISTAEALKSLNALTAATKLPLELSKESPSRSEGPKCKKCSKVLPSHTGRARLHQFMCKRLNNQRYKCKYLDCQMGFHKYKQKEHHEFRFHTESKCDNCGKKMVTAMLNAHMKICKNSNLPIRIREKKLANLESTFQKRSDPARRWIPFKCEIKDCKETFVSGIDKTAHMMKVHKYVRRFNSRGRSKLYHPNSAGSSVTCEYCQKEMQTTSMGNHLKLCKAKKNPMPYGGGIELAVCDVCGAGMLKSQLPEHLETHSKDQADKSEVMVEEKEEVRQEGEEGISDEVELIERPESPGADNPMPMNCPFDDCFATIQQSNLRVHLKKFHNDEIGKMTEQDLEEMCRALIQDEDLTEVICLD